MLHDPLRSTANTFSLNSTRGISSSVSFSVLMDVTHYLVPCSIEVTWYPCVFFFITPTTVGTTNLLSKSTYSFPYMSCVNFFVLSVTSSLFCTCHISISSCFYPNPIHPSKDLLVYEFDREGGGGQKDLM